MGDDRTLPTSHNRGAVADPAAMSPERRDPEGESRRDLAVGERSVTHGKLMPREMRLKDANCRLND